MALGITSKTEMLLERVKRSTAFRGQKSELARYLKITRQQLNSWFSGVHFPDAETALRLLEWVIEAEAKQQKAPGDGINTAKGEKTRKRKSLHENLKSGP